MRITREPIEIGGHLVKEKRVLQLLLAAANRDEEVFERPDEVDITRKPNPHLGFAGGVHHCLGNQLARAEAEIVFRKLAERVTDFEPGAKVIRPKRAARTFVSVPVVLHPA